MIYGHGVSYFCGYMSRVMGGMGANERYAFQAEYSVLPHSSLEVTASTPSHNLRTFFALRERFVFEKQKSKIEVVMWLTKRM